MKVKIKLLIRNTIKANDLTVLLDENDCLPCLEPNGSLEQTLNDFLRLKPYEIVRAAKAAFFDLDDTLFLVYNVDVYTNSKFTHAGNTKWVSNAVFPAIYDKLTDADKRIIFGRL